MTFCEIYELANLPNSTFEFHSPPPHIKAHLGRMARRGRKRSLSPYDDESDEPRKKGRRGRDARAPGPARPSLASARSSRPQPVPLSSQLTPGQREALEFKVSTSTSTDRSLESLPDATSMGLMKLAMARRDQLEERWATYDLMGQELGEWISKTANLIWSGANPPTFTFHPELPAINFESFWSLLKEHVEKHAWKNTVIPGPVLRAWIEQAAAKKTGKGLLTRNAVKPEPRGDAIDGDSAPQIQDPGSSDALEPKIRNELGDVAPAGPESRLLLITRQLSDVASSLADAEAARRYAVTAVPSPGLVVDDNSVPATRVTQASQLVTTDALRDTAGRQTEATMTGLAAPATGSGMQAAFSYADSATQTSDHGAQMADAAVQTTKTKTRTILVDAGTQTEQMIQPTMSMEQVEGDDILDNDATEQRATEAASSDPAESLDINGDHQMTDAVALAQAESLVLPEDDEEERRFLNPENEEEILLEEDSQEDPLYEDPAPTAAMTPDPSADEGAVTPVAASNDVQPGTATATASVQAHVGGASLMAVLALRPVRHDQSDMMIDDTLDRDVE